MASSREIERRARASASASVGDVKGFESSGIDAQVKVDLGLNGSPDEVDHYEPAGLEINPLDDDQALCVPAGPVSACVGYADAHSPREGARGEPVLYARDASGARVARVWLKRDGTIEIYNENGSIKMEPNGTVNINGVEISADGTITAPEVVAGGVALSGHLHAYTDDGAPSTTQGPQAPPPP